MTPCTVFLALAAMALKNVLVCNGLKVNRDKLAILRDLMCRDLTNEPLCYLQAIPIKCYLLVGDEKAYRAAKYIDDFLDLVEFVLQGFRWAVGKATELGFNCLPQLRPKLQLAFMLWGENIIYTFRLNVAPPWFRRSKVHP